MHSITSLYTRLYLATQLLQTDVVLPVNIFLKMSEQRTADVNIPHSTVRVQCQYTW